MGTARRLPHFHVAGRAFEVEAIRPSLRLAFFSIAAWRLATGPAGQGIAASHTLGCSTVTASLFGLLLDNRSYLTYRAHGCHIPETHFLFPHLHATAD